MADVKISQLPSASSVTTSTTMAVVQSGTTYQTTVNAVGNAILGAENPVAIGPQAGQINQGTNSIAIGSGAAQLDQGTGAVAIGPGAGGNTQGQYAIGIGQFAGGSFSTPQSDSSIVLNATGAGLNAVTQGFFVAPVRNASTSQGLYYNTTTKEISYSTAGGGAGTGDWTFTDNVASLPFNANAVISTSGNVTTDTRATTSYPSSAWNLCGSMTLYSTTGGQGGPSAPYYLSYGTEGDATFINTLKSIPVGSAITMTMAGTGAITTGTTTAVAYAGNMSSWLIPMSGAEGQQTNGPITALTVTTGALVVSNVSGVYTFETDGTFVSDTLLAGNIYIDNNIITPTPIVTIDSYGNETDTPVPVVVNGNLQVQGNLSLTSTNIALGNGAAAGGNSISIGVNAGAGGNISTINIGFNTGTSGQNAGTIAIGASAGNVNQNLSAIAIGGAAGNSSQGEQAIAIGGQAGQTSQSPLGVAVGYLAGSGYQGIASVAVGPYAALTGQGTQSVAIGRQAGEYSQSDWAIALGAGTASSGQGNAAIAIGAEAGATNQGINAIAIGAEAGRQIQGANAVAIGAYAGGNTSFSQGANSICINATGTYITPVQSADTFVVKPVRNGGSGGSLPNGFFQMAYNPTTGEIIYWS